jgi:hypothetical protein
MWQGDGAGWLGLRRLNYRGGTAAQRISRQGDVRRDTSDEEQVLPDPDRAPRSKRYTRSLETDLGGENSHPGLFLLDSRDES